MFQPKRARISVQVSTSAGGDNEPSTSSTSSGSTPTYRIPIQLARDPMNPMYPIGISIANSLPYMLPNLQSNMGSSVPIAVSLNLGDLKPEEYVAKVFVWDIDDLTMLSKPQLEVAPKKRVALEADVQLLNELLENVLKSAGLSEEHVQLMECCDSFNDINPVHSSPLANSIVRRNITLKLNALKEFYNDVAEILDDTEIISEELIRRCGMAGREMAICQAARNYQEYFEISWKGGIKKCLQLAKKKSGESHKKFANVVISSHQIGYGAAQLLVAGQAPEVPFDNIYSTARLSLESVFIQVKQRFGEKCSLVFITSDTNYADVAEKLKIPVWSVQDYDAFDKLYMAQTAFSYQ